MANNQREISDNRSADRVKGIALGAGAGMIAGAVIGNPGVDTALGAAVGVIFEPTELHRFK